MAFSLLLNCVGRSLEVIPEETPVKILRNNLERIGTKYGWTNSATAISKNSSRNWTDAISKGKA